MNAAELAIGDLVYVGEFRTPATVIDAKSFGGVLVDVKVRFVERGLERWFPPSMIFSARTASRPEPSGAIDTEFPCS